MVRLEIYIKFLDVSIGVPRFNWYRSSSTEYPGNMGYRDLRHMSAEFKKRNQWHRSNGRAARYKEIEGGFRCDDSSGLQYTLILWKGGEEDGTR